MTHEHDRDFTPEEDAKLAIEVLAEGDIGHAFHHACAALACAPLRAEYEELLEQVLARADDPEALLALEPNVWFGKAAARAHWLRKRGELGEATDLILSVAEARPDLPFLAWPARWLAHGGAAKAIDRELAQTLSRKLLRIVRQPGRELEDASRILDVLRELHEDLAIVHYATSALCRRTGAFADGVKHAERAALLEPSYMMFVALASAKRDAGDLAGAVLAFEEALRIDPENLDIRLDLGDLALDLGDPAKAQERYREVLAAEPDHPWALPSMMFARHRAGDVRARAELVAFSETNETNQRAVHLARLASPFLRFLPVPSDATANLLSKLEGKPTTGDVRVSVSSLEAPSVHAAFELLAPGSKLVVSVSEVQTPDPRVPRRDVEHLLWRYEELRPVAVPVPPPRELAERLATIARERFDLDTWQAMAAGVAAEVGPGALQGLLGAMVHPPARDPDFLAVYWVFRVQVAAALVIAELDRGWATSRRRAVLLDLANGPMDWTVAAAAVALARIAVTEEAARKEVDALFFALLNEIPRPGSCCYEHCVAAVWQWLPGLDADLSAVLLERQLAVD